MGGGIDNVVSALGAGAIDFGSSRSAPKRLHVSLRSVLNTSALEGELNRIKKEPQRYALLSSSRKSPAM